MPASTPFPSLTPQLHMPPPGAGPCAAKTANVAEPAREDGRTLRREREHDPIFIARPSLSQPSSTPGPRREHIARRFVTPVRVWLSDPERREDLARKPPPVRWPGLTVPCEALFRSVGLRYRYSIPKRSVTAPRMRVKRPSRADGGWWRRRPRRPGGRTTPPPRS